MRAYNQQEVVKLLDEATEYCEAKGARFTSLRKEVFRRVLQSAEPIKAYDLIDQMSTRDHQVKPPTVYRTLDFLQEQGLVHKIDKNNAFIACADPIREHHAIYVVCSDCGKVQELNDTSLARIIQINLHQLGFSLDQSQAIDIRVSCQTCDKTMLPTKNKQKTLKRVQDEFQIT